MGSSVRHTRRRVALHATHLLLAAAAIQVFVLGPMLVLCRAPNGSVAARILFFGCPTQAGCCAEVRDPRQPACGAGPELLEGCRRSGCGAEHVLGGLASTEADDTCAEVAAEAGSEDARGSCSEIDIFHYLNHQGPREEHAGDASAPPATFGWCSPATTASALVTSCLAGALRHSLPPAPHEVFRVLRI